MTPEALAWIERQKSDLVRAAEGYVAASKIHLDARQDRGGKARVSRGQLRNLLNVAQSERSLAVLVNFLRYQIGRQKQGWGDEPSGKLLETLLQKEVRQRCEVRCGDKDAASLGVAVEDLEAALMPLLLGFIVREYTYRSAEAGTRTDG